MTQCETCCFYNYDEEYDEYICDVDLDEDEMVRFLSGRGDCPYWRPGDEYRTARRQYAQIWVDFSTALWYNGPNTANAVKGENRGNGKAV